MAVQVGQAAPPISASTAAGAPWQLQQQRGKVVYIDFWASWCAPCRQALPVLQQLRDRHSAQGFEVLTVNVDSERADAHRMMQRLNLQLPVIFDAEGAIAQRYALPGMPAGYLIGRDGLVAYVHSGYKSSDLPQLEAELERALQKKRKPRR